jgi:hypothetical protein
MQVTVEICGVMSQNLYNQYCLSCLAFLVYYKTGGLLLQHINVTVTSLKKLQVQST